MSYVPVRKLPFTTSPTADMVRYGLGAIVSAAATPWGAREVLNEFLNALMATPFAWTGCRISPQTGISQPRYDPGDVSNPKPECVRWPATQWIEAKGAWNTAVRFTGSGALGIPDVPLKDLIPLVRDMINRLPLAGPRTGAFIPQWMKLALGILGVGIVGAFFLGRGKRAPIAVRKKPRRRVKRRAVRRRSRR